MRVNIKEKNLFSEVITQMLPEIKLAKFKGLAIDSRKVEPGDIFLPLKGENTDGHCFISQAEDAGAILTFVELPVDPSFETLQVSSTKQFLFDLIHNYRKKLPYPFFGITGSNGKTTTKDLLCHILSAEMKVMRTQGNFNSTIGAPLSLLEFEADADIAVIEMGANKYGEIETICNVIQPDMGLITNIGEAHLEYFGTINNIALTKSALFASLPTKGKAFVNLDDPFIANMTIPCSKITFSLKSNTDCQGFWSIDRDDKILRINNNIINLSAYPDSMCMNSLAVYSIATCLGLDIPIIISQIESFKMPEGRGDVVLIQNITVINDSYNSNLDSARIGIHNLKTMTAQGRKIAVIGDMLELGNKDQEHHHFLGRLLQDNNVDAVFAYGDLTRHTIHAMNGATVFHEFYQEKELLLSDLKEFIQEGDIIYIKGSRGMKMEDILTGLKT